TFARFNLRFAMPSSEVNLTLVGGPTLLIEIAGLRLLTDPTFDPPGQYESNEITLKKTIGPAVSAEQIGAVDAVLLSHDHHFDNLDRAGRDFLPKAQTVLTTQSGGGRLGAGAKGLAPWEEAVIRNQAGQQVVITATPARHGPAGIERIAGDVIGFAIGVNQPG